MVPRFSTNFMKHSIQCRGAVLLNFFFRSQCAKKVVSDSPGLVDFALGLDNSVFNLPNSQVMFFEEFE